MQNVEGNKDSNTVDFDCNNQCYKQVYQEMRNPNDLQNIMHNESKKREIRKCDTEIDLIENESISGMFRMKHQKNAPDVLMQKDLGLYHPFPENEKKHFDDKLVYVYSDSSSEPERDLDPENEKNHFDDKLVYVYSDSSSEPERDLDPENEKNILIINWFMVVQILHQSVNKIQILDFWELMRIFFGIYQKALSMIQFWKSVQSQTIHRHQVILKLIRVKACIIRSTDDLKLIQWF
ncbi:hypothetical protein CEXT_347481 [Caerostris extrusa]|uniref:Uncharacterized protein n=1 Tax=Caerostris extrusa TaxID=172846 RepID=A0AAV4UVT5_CAEEX|nr:hypothetical protein CEXT_347481 [Caerostris extrusa]